MRNISTAGMMAIDQFSQFELIFMEQAGDRPAGLQQLDDLFAHGSIVVAQYGRAAGLQEVDVSIAVRIPEVSTIGFFDSNGKGIVEGQIMLDAAGNELFGLVGQRFRAGTLRIKIGDELLELILTHPSQRLVDQRIKTAVDVVNIRILGNCIFLRITHRNLLIIDINCTSFQLSHVTLADFAFSHRTMMVRCENLFQHIINSIPPTAYPVNELCFFLERFERISPLLDRSCQFFMCFGVFLKRNTLERGIYCLAEGFASCHRPLRMCVNSPT